MLFGYIKKTLHVEKVYLLSKIDKVKHYVNMALDMDKLDITSSDGKAIYEEIKSYVPVKHGSQVTSHFITQVKGKSNRDVNEYLWMGQE